MGHSRMEERARDRRRNAVVFKPSELTPATSALLAEIYEEAGLAARRVQHGGRPRLGGR